MASHKPSSPNHNSQKKNDSPLAQTPPSKEQKIGQDTTTTGIYNTNDSNSPLYPNTFSQNIPHDQNLNQQQQQQHHSISTSNTSYPDVKSRNSLSEVFQWETHQSLPISTQNTQPLSTPLANQKEILGSKNLIDDNTFNSNKSGSTSNEPQPLSTPTPTKNIKPPDDGGASQQQFLGLVLPPVSTTNTQGPRRHQYRLNPINPTTSPSTNPSSSTTTEEIGRQTSTPQTSPQNQTANQFGILQDQQAWSSSNVPTMTTSTPNPTQQQHQGPRSDAIGVSNSRNNSDSTQYSNIPLPTFYTASSLYAQQPKRQQESSSSQHSTFGQQPDTIPTPTSSSHKTDDEEFTESGGANFILPEIELKREDDPGDEDISSKNSTPSPTAAVLGIRKDYNRHKHTSSGGSSYGGGTGVGTQSADTSSSMIIVSDNGSRQQRQYHELLSSCQQAIKSLTEFESKYNQARPSLFGSGVDLPSIKQTAEDLMYLDKEGSRPGSSDERRSSLPQQQQQRFGSPSSSLSPTFDPSVAHKLMQVQVWLNDIYKYLEAAAVPSTNTSHNTDNDEEMKDYDDSNDSYDRYKPDENDRSIILNSQKNNFLVPPQQSTGGSSSTNQQDLTMTSLFPPNSDRKSSLSYSDESSTSPTMTSGLPPAYPPIPPPPSSSSSSTSSLVATTPLVSTATNTAAPVPPNPSTTTPSSSSSNTLSCLSSVPQYRMNRNISTIHEMVQEWYHGINGGPSVYKLELQYGSKWRTKNDAERVFLGRRRIIINKLEEKIRQEVLSFDSDNEDNNDNDGDNDQNNPQKSRKRKKKTLAEIVDEMESERKRLKKSIDGLGRYYNQLAKQQKKQKLDDVDPTLSLSAPTSPAGSNILSSSSFSSSSTSASSSSTSNPVVGGGSGSVQQDLAVQHQVEANDRKALMDFIYSSTSSSTNS